jgi:hypothetical protein
VTVSLHPAQTPPLIPARRLRIIRASGLDPIMARAAKPENLMRDAERAIAAAANEAGDALRPMDGMR